MTELPEGISEWAALSGPAVVLDAVRLRAQRGYRTETGVLQAVLSAGQRREVAKLLGTPWDVSGRPVRLQDLAAALAEHRLTVRGLVEAVDGHSIDDRRVIRARMTARAERERLAARHLLVVAGLPESTVDTFLSDGSLPSAGSGELTELMAQVRTVWQVLPDAAGKPVRLAQLAATVFGDAHALDWHTALGRAVARLAASVHRLPRPLRGGKQWRQALAVAGVRCDGVSSRALVLNLPLRGDAPAVAFCG
ncbi:MAG: TIGR02679 domain-containing protein, partial [Sciscionella sp.]